MSTEPTNARDLMARNIDRATEALSANLQGLGKDALPSAEQAVIDQIKARSAKGLSKYGVTTDRQDLSLSDWVQHAQEEAMDLAVYLEKVKQIAKQENAQNDRLELSELRNLVEYQADKIKAMEAKLGALDRVILGLLNAKSPSDIETLYDVTYQDVLKVRAV